ncbi:hypothetical protein AC1031_006325 [Aphanomyces cochlioides]|nr:hypothetical protein AC1031_006325 [Aphanomyces cochlioides]
MDNAKYHRKKPCGTPNGSMKKTDMIDACTSYGLAVYPRSSKAVVWNTIKSYLDLNVKPEIETMAIHRNHSVAWTPPYHSDMQPIELVWSDVKGKVGRQYTAETTFEDVRRRLEQAFDTLSSQTIYNCIAHTEKKIAEMNKYLEDLDAADEPVSDGEDWSGSEITSDDEPEIL